VTFPDYDALVVESKPDIAGADVRLAMLRRGAEIERERILEVLRNWTVRGDGDYPEGYRDALDAVMLIVKDEKSIKMMDNLTDLLGVIGK
jgi:hypothetical protein